MAGSSFDRTTGSSPPPADDATCTWRACVSNLTGHLLRFKKDRAAARWSPAVAETPGRCLPSDAINMMIIFILNLIVINLFMVH